MDQFGHAARNITRRAQHADVFICFYDVDVCSDLVHLPALSPESTGYSQAVLWKSAWRSGGGKRTGRKGLDRIHRVTQVRITKGTLSLNERIEVSLDLRWPADDAG